MDEDFIADGADFAGAEEAGHGDWGGWRGEGLATFGERGGIGGGQEGGGDGVGVVMGLIEEACAASVASEEQDAFRRVVEALSVEEHGEVFVGGLSVADVELDGLSDADEISDGDGFLLFFDADDVSDDEVIATEAVFVFVDGAPDEEAASEFGALGRVESVEHLGEDAECGAAGELGDHLTFACGDDHGFADGFATLADERVDADIAAE